MSMHQRTPELLTPAASDWATGVRLMAIKEEDQNSIINRPARSTYPKQKSVSTGGATPNYTYADGKQTSLVTNGDDRLVGTSKNTYNLSGYFENAHFSARLTYTYRSAFFSGLDRNTAFSQDAIGGLAASFAYTLNDQLSFTLDGQNLNNPTLKYYALNTDQPRAFYRNGQQYYFTVRFKM
ncbi:MAG: TonB-dependent receptor [Gammaproteobacteria bacterium]|nr:TonB-dependent receptor [Gammaproteobacteria bacterium]